jgi:hypothetical protein
VFAIPMDATTAATTTSNEKTVVYHGLITSSPSSVKSLPNENLQTIVILPSLERRGSDFNAAVKKTIT